MQAESRQKIIFSELSAVGGVENCRNISERYGFVHYSQSNFQSNRFIPFEETILFIFK